jgi:hypothetical protein
MAAETIGTGTETTVGEAMVEELERKVVKIEGNIRDIKNKLKREDIPNDKKRLLEFNRDKAEEALSVLNKQLETLSDFIRI